ncbi:hypothetical protein DBV39_04095 [Orrella marina]|uniref:Uncharacterized protein n=1 Tax=Orrella marina TaxID=2163011 RepID=A0A2R4XGV6_9BURK|nr:hypothetical protein DBV39_04095 [Orrella marina]
MRDRKSIWSEKLIFDQIDTQAVVGFLNWFETIRNNTASTRNQCFSVIHAVILHVRICAGAPGNRCPYRDQRFNRTVRYEWLSQYY